MKKSDYLTVKVSNDVNSLITSQFTEKEIDIFISLMFKLQGAGTQQFILQKNEMKELCGFIGFSDERYVSSVNSLFEKMHKIIYKQKVGSKSIIISLFDHSIVDEKTGDIEIQAGETFSKMLTNVKPGWFLMELNASKHIKTKYAKHMYSYLSQWYNAGGHEYEKDEFREMLGIPDSYKASITKKQILEPIVRELSPVFQNLKYEVVKQGRKVAGYNFTFDVDEKEEKKVQQPKSNKIVVPAPAWSGQEYKDTTSEDDKNKFAEWQRKLKEMK